jgi:uncharacterized protein (TIGR02145 family)
MRFNVFYILAFFTFFYGCQKEIDLDEDNLDIEKSTFTDTRDNITYNAVKIGNQIWMAENLAYLPAVSSASVGSLKSKYYYVYDYNGTDIKAAKSTANYDTYGVLYNWPAALGDNAYSNTNPSGVQGVCPPGWHLPSDDEWKQLEMTLGMTQEEADSYYSNDSRGTDQGIKLKAINGWSSNINGTNTSGFTALPGGYRGWDGRFHNVIDYGGWWTASYLRGGGAGRHLYGYSTGVHRSYHNWNVGLSVRCIKDELSKASKPIVITINPSLITKDAVILGGNVTNNGGYEVIARGVVWGTNQNPTIEINKGITNEGDGNGSFTANITDLVDNTLYYIRAYATNSKGTGYGSHVTVTVNPINPVGSFTDIRDNKTYKWVKIGAQVWMAENLAYLPAISSTSTGSSTTKHFYIYDWSFNGSVEEAKSTSVYNKYGVLYNWIAAMNGAASSNANPSSVQGICPEGWHLPSDAEWDVLENYLIANGYNYDGSTSGNKYAKSLKAEILWDTPGNNSSGFTGLPGGYREYDMAFKGMREMGCWWSSTENVKTRSWSRHLYNHSNGFNRNYYFKKSGLSVRCIKNN